MNTAKRHLALLITTTLTISINVGNHGATQVTTNPTTAPSKTPTQTTIETTNDETQQLSRQQLEPLSQEDLSVLTGNIQRPNGLFWFDNKLYTSCTGDWTIYEIDIETKATVQYIFGVRNSHTLYIERDEQNDETNLWIPDFQTNTLTHINRSGLEVAASNLNGPWGIASLNQNHFLVTNLLGNNAVRISRDGATEDVLTNLRSPTGVAVDGEIVYIANTGSARRAIEWFSSDEITETSEPIDTENNSTPHTLVTGLQNTTNITIAGDGYLYFTYALGTRGIVGRVNPQACRDSGGCTHDQVEIVIYTELATPLAGLTISPNMQLFIHSMFSPDIYWVQLPTTSAESS
jgi:hypothetical protein